MLNRLLRFFQKNTAPSFVAALLTLTLSLAPQASAQSTGTIQGSVMDARRARPKCPGHGA